MTHHTKTPIYRKDDDEFLGFIIQDSTSWQAQTIFGYVMTRTQTREEAEKFLQTNGLHYLEGTWHYFDSDDHDWFTCVIQEASEHRVIIIRTNELGYQDPDIFKRVILKNPDENVLVKNS